MAINKNLRRNFVKTSGSSFVSSAPGQPTVTIQPLASRAAENTNRFASNVKFNFDLEKTI